MCHASQPRDAGEGVRRRQPFVEIEHQVDAVAGTTGGVGCELGEHRNRFDEEGLFLHRASIAHGTIWAMRVTTTSSPPAALSRGITAGRSSRGTAALTA